VSSTNLMASRGSMVFLGDDRLGKETRRLGSFSLVCSMIQPCIFYRYQYNRVYICIIRVDVARKTTASSSQGRSWYLAFTLQQGLIMIVRPATITNGNLGLDGPSYYSPSSHPRGHLYSGFPEAVKADQS